MREDDQAGLSRRGLMTQVGAAGMVWVAPAITRITVAAAAPSHEPDAGLEPGPTLDAGGQGPVDRRILTGVSTGDVPATGATGMPRTGSDDPMRLIKVGLALLGGGGSLIALDRWRGRWRSSASERGDADEPA